MTKNNIYQILILAVLVLDSGISFSQTATLTPTGASSGNNDGLVKVYIDNVDPPFSYTIYQSGLAPRTVNNISYNPFYIYNLKAGTHNISIRSDSGCSVHGTVTVVQCPNVNFTATIDPYCYGTGAVFTANVTGGAPPPFQYTWHTKGGGTKSTPSHILGTDKVLFYTGQYGVSEICLSITTSDGCVSDQKCYDVPTRLNHYLEYITPVTVSSLGAIHIDAYSSYSPITYQWSNGATTQDITNLTEGTYSVTINDGECTRTDSYTVTDNRPSPVITLNNTDDTCEGKNQGSVNINITGGAGFTYQWSNGATTQDISNLSAGNYCVTVTNSYGKTDDACFTVGTYPSIPTNSYDPLDCNRQIVICSNTGETVGYIDHPSTIFTNFSDCTRREYCQNGGSQVILSGSSGKEYAAVYFPTGDETLPSSVSCTIFEGCNIGGIFYEQFSRVASTAGFSPRACPANAPASCPSGCGYYLVCEGYTTTNFICEADLRLINSINRGLNTNIITYPNPFKNELNIKLRTLAKENVKIIVYNSIGTLINSQSFSVSDGENILSLNFDSDISTGIYYLKVVDDNGNEIGTKKIIHSK